MGQHHLGGGRGGARKDTAMWTVPNLRKPVRLWNKKFAGCLLAVGFVPLASGCLELSWFQVSSRPLAVLKQAKLGVL